MRAGCLGTETIVDFVEGRAEPSVRSRVERHTARCENCRVVLAALAHSRTSSESVLPRTQQVAAGVNVGRYVVVRELGSGGMGVVYAAQDPELGRTVAVKVLRRADDLDMQARLRREAQSMARLAHPNVVAIYDVGAFGDQVFIAMEYIEGQTLAHWLKEPRPVAALLERFRAAGHGLAAAHAAGIVHRDFKPANVLLGDDGRVCVSDFGVARTADHRELAPVPDDALVPTTGESRVVGPIVHNAPTMQLGLTATGALIGTPYFMAPELHRGDAADPRSDQFSFCVALLAALHGGPLDTAGLSPVARAERLQEIAMTRMVPRRIRAALHRGLAPDPASRFDSLDPLLARLAPLHRPVRWMAATASVMLVGILAFAWQSVRSQEVPDQRCTGADAAYAATWNPQRRAAIAAAFAASKAPVEIASTTLGRVTAALDDYAARWRQAHTEACRATRIFAEQTEPTLELRMSCLERRRQSAAALADTFATASAGVVTHAVEAAVELPDLAGCSDLAALSQAIPPPSDPVVRGKLGELNARLADARAKLDTGSYAAGLVLAGPIANEARALGYQPFIAEAEYLQGMLEVQARDRSHAETSLRDAMLAAEAGRSDEVVARANAALILVIGQYEREPARAFDLVPFAQAAVARLGDNPDVQSALEGALGAVYYSEDAVDAAIPHLQNALDLARRAHGPEHPATEYALRRLAAARLSQGHPDQTIDLAQRALDIVDRVLGAGHPAAAYDLRLLGNAHVADGQIKLAEQELRQALDIAKASLGDHPTVADTMTDIARALRAQNRSEDAVAMARAAVELSERVQGADHPSHAQQLIEYGNALEQAGHYDEATRQLHHAEAIFTKTYGANHVTVAKVRFLLAEILCRQARWQACAAAYEGLIPVFQRAENIGDYLVSSEENLAEAALALHDPARAGAALAPIASDPIGKTPRVHGYVAFLKARAVLDSTGDRKQVSRLVAAARAELVAAGPEGNEGVGVIDEWLTKHAWARSP